MSLLLDALKKSEAQRRRGRAPSVDLASTPARQPPPSSRRRWPWLILPVAVIALGTWQWPTIERLIAPPSDADASPVAGAPPVSNPSDPVPTPTPGPDRGTSNGGESVADPDVGSAPSSAAGRQASRTTEAPSAPPDASVADAAADAWATRSNQPEAPTMQAAAAEPADSETDPPSPEAQAPARRTEPQPAPTPERMPETDSALEGAIRPWELPQASRSEFPELDLTVHYYAVEPGERFVLINGERYRQGDRLEGDVRIRRIVQRGVLLEFGSYLVLLE